MDYVIVHSSRMFQIFVCRLKFVCLWLLNPNSMWLLTLTFINVISLIQIILFSCLLFSDVLHSPTSHMSEVEVNLPTHRWTSDLSHHSWSSITVCCWLFRASSRVCIKNTLSIAVSMVIPRWTYYMQRSVPICRQGKAGLWLCRSDYGLISRRLYRTVCLIIE